jgi:hypothetical protein
MMDVRHAEFDDYAVAFSEMLQRVGIELTTMQQNGSSVVREKAGLLAGAGTLKAIDEGRIGASESVLISLTGGAGPKFKDQAVPELWIAAQNSQVEIAKYANEVLKDRNLTKAQI